MQKAMIAAISMSAQPHSPPHIVLNPRFLDLLRGYTNIRSMPVACALIPRFRLMAAVAEPRILKRPAALAPEPGAAQLIGEVSAPAERFGLRPGMRMGEALSRCPELALVPPDPERAERAWEEALRRLEGIGAEVESGRAGEAFFEAAGLGGLWGGIEGVLEGAREEPGSSAQLAPRRSASAPTWRAGSGSSR